MAPFSNRGAKISRAAWLEAFDEQIEGLEAVCSFKHRGKNYRKQLLKHRLESLQQFLEQAAFRTPNMDYSLRLEFGDVLDLVNMGEGVFPQGEESFAAFYQDHFRVPSDREPNDWPHAWANVLFSSIKCAHAN